MTALDLKLLTLLQEKKLLTAEQVQQVKLESVQSKKTEEAIILEKNLIPEKDYYRVKSEKYNIPFLEDINTLKPPESLLSQVSSDLIKEQQTIPFEETDQVIKIVMSDPFDIHAIQSWKVKFPQKKIEVYAGTPSEIRSFINVQLSSAITGEVKEALAKVEEPQEAIKEIDVDATETLESAKLQDAPIAKIVNSILVFATQIDSSDIHIEPMESQIRIRYRVDGVMSERLALPKTVQSAITARLKIMSDLKIDETRMPQDGRLFINVSDRKFDLRISFVPTVYGEKIVMRLLERSTGIPPLETSGLRGTAYQRYIDATSLTTGIILVTGPTGSGKSQTLAGTLSRLNKPGVNIVTAENPVEFRIRGVNQIQINHDIGLDFSIVLRSILRQDPDIVMVGEIRDKETAELAVRAALTGHLVLSTLHTNDAASAVPRLVDMGIEPYLVTSTVRAVVAQRLVRTICMHCRQAVLMDEPTLHNVTEKLSQIKGFDLDKYLTLLADRKAPNDDPSSIEYRLNPPIQPMEIDKKTGEKKIYLYKGKGCAVCGQSGYKGRTGIFEVLNMTEQFADMVIENRPAEELEVLAIKQGMIPMTLDGYLKALEGITTIEEVLRVAKS